MGLKWPNQRQTLLPLLKGPGILDTQITQTLHMVFVHEILWPCYWKWPTISKATFGESLDKIYLFYSKKHSIESGTPILSCLGH